ncbi:hypothetical protein LTS18_012371 [Coniosporium uncinatum]|uniref:Uncharacterized protein n=1 Tax=Coniosporium uncinatum TaxID=93489 RepID=A0ACC3D9N2_9PEZI|nr:hypothetical protein LTS18_012371 [Coniosporium uncinatum]
MSVDATWLIVPVDKAGVQKAVKAAYCGLSNVPLLSVLCGSKTAWPLLPVPANLFPNFPAGKHPVIVQQSYNHDIRQTIANNGFFIQALRGSSIVVPLVDRLRDGKTSFNLHVLGFLNSTVPEVAGTIGGVTLQAGCFTPDSSAYEQDTSNPNQYRSQSRNQILSPTLLPCGNCPLGAPCVEPSNIDMYFKSAQSPYPYTLPALKSLLNAPTILNFLGSLANGAAGGFPGSVLGGCKDMPCCERDTTYFNYSSAQPMARVGISVKLYEPQVPAGLGGSYGDSASSRVGGFSACGQLIGGGLEECKVAAARVDRTAL